MANDDVSIRFGAEIGGATSAITQLREVLQGVISPIRGIRQNLGELAEAFIAAFAVEKIVALVEKMAELGTQTERTMAVLGISAKEVGELSLMATVTGSSVQSMTMSMQRLQTNLQTASDPASKTGKAIAAIGLSAKDLVGLPIPDQMDKIADGLSKFADGGNKTAIAMALLGRGAAGLLPAMAEGSEGLERIRKMADDASATLTNKTAHALADVHEHSATLGAALNSLGASIVAFFGPVISTIVQTMTDLVSQINVAIQTGTLWDTLCLGMAYIWNKFIQNLITGGQIIKDVLSLNWGEINSHWKEGLEAQLKLQEAHVAALAAMKLKAQDALDDADGDAEDAKKGNKKQAPGIDMGTSTRASAAMKEIDGEIKAMQTGLAEKKLILEQEVAQHQKTQNEKFAELQEYTDAAYEMEKSLLQQELGLSGITVEQKAAVNAKLLELEAKHSLETTKITGEAVKAQQKLYQDMFDSVQSAFNNQLRGLLAGTTSWKNAFKTILGDLIIAFIQAIEKMVFQYLAGQLAMTAGNAAGNTARTASDGVAAAASTSLTVGTAIESILASAAKTFAGIFGFLAPAMGPAAAGPAAAGEAVVAAATGAIYEQGTPWVPSTGWALLHKGEAVIPAGVNAAGLGGGASVTNVTHIHNWHAVDGQSVARFVRNNATMMNKILGSRASLTPSG